VCVRLVAGDKVRSLSDELGVSEATLYLWKRQALIDAGRSEGVKSFAADELARAHTTIAELEVELEERALLKLASSELWSCATWRGRGVKTTASASMREATGSRRSFLSRNQV